MGHRFILILAMLLLPMAAGAQSQAGGTNQTGTTAPSLLIPLEPPEALPASGTAGGYFFNLRPLGADFGRSLADRGIYLDARSLSAEFGNVSGGVTRGGLFEGYTALGFDLDMNRIAGIPGGAVHFLAADLQGQSFAAYSGSSYLNNRIFAGSGPAFRLNELSYEQSLFDKRVNLRLGRVPAYTQFDGSELYCTFLTSLCRTPAAYTFDRGYPPYLTASWAAVAQVRLSGPFYANVGVFEDEPILSTTSHHDFPGRDWGLNYATGATIPAQLGYRTTIKDDPYPRAFSVGGFYDTGRYADPLLNASGRNRIQFGGMPKMDIGSSLFYVQAQQMVYRPDSSDRGLTVFGGADWATSGQPNVERMVFAGAYDKGLFPSRPNDTLGVSVSVLNVNPRIAERVSSTIAKSGGGQASRAEIGFEVNYGVAIAPGLTVKPFVQYISHPDQAVSTRPTGNNTHAMFVGALLEVDAAHLFGLPAIGQ